MVRRFHGWAAALIDLVMENVTTPVLRPIYALPTGHRWDRLPGMTLIGDAAHLVSPFTGQGANLAMFDAAELAKHAVAESHRVDHAVRGYESALFTRSMEAAARSAENLPRFVGEDAPHSDVELFRTICAGYV